MSKLTDCFALKTGGVFIVFYGCADHLKQQRFRAGQVREWLGDNVSYLGAGRKSGDTSANFGAGHGKRRGGQDKSEQR